MSTPVEPSPSPARLDDADHDHAETDFQDDHPTGIHPDSAQNGDDAHAIVIRSLVSTKDAGVIIGKGGKNVAEIRTVTGVKAGVSKVVPGVPERILTISGSLDHVAKAYSMIARFLLDSPQNGQTHQPDQTTVRILITTQLMGSIIGKGGSRIRDIQEHSGAKIVVSKEMLPQSTERVVEITGLVDSIQIAVYEIGESILGDARSKNTGAVPYNPQSQVNGTFASPLTRGPPSAVRREGEKPRETPDRAPSGSVRRQPSRGENRLTESTGPETSQTLSIPADMVGCVIGKGGSFITQIRILSGSRLRIADQAENSNERVITITGTFESNQKALNLLYTQLEAEKKRRLEQAR
ncbi:uncharacterized protein BJ171DRAFT_517979 [Polychytrium aggregatum]|uniref:uncharacterized protein n=1 Tax=Polychytrium aggregatum TaxID=110093 RepID=UPI0022FF1413|nr:uncharacterized protein BJ171DRAFT_517979 [Polychytrium aggregatum]KAI9199577.1 hypothetical protein BJ171DRAFT_517979 [Polychytrium aggregatum]